MTQKPDIAELSQANYAGWRQHPMTIVFLGYLDAYAKRMIADASTRWRSGETDPKIEQYSRGVVDALEEIARCDFASIQQFYGVAKPEDEGTNGESPT